MVEIMTMVDEGLGNSSYLIDIGDQRALVLDPARDPTPYLATAERRGLTVAFAAETHLHADFVSGSRELAAKGAKVIAPSGSGIEYPHHGLADSATVDLGGLRLQALATPGHTPEHLSYLLMDGDTPIAVFTGGALLPGSAARTDLISPDQTEALARSLWRSVRENLLSLPDDLPVYPTHGGGSFCSTDASGDRTTTIGRERQASPLFTAPDEDTFVRYLLGGYGTYPRYFARLRELNRKGPRIYGTLPPLEQIGPAQVEKLIDEGAYVIDARSVTRFAEGHIPGSISIHLRPAFASWVGWLVPDGAKMVFVLDPSQDRSDLIRQCLNIGYENLAGELMGGVDAWREAGLPVTTTRIVRADELDGSMLDVRQDSEFAMGHIPGAAHIELGSLADKIDEVPAGPITVTCAHGERAMTGASLLERAGLQDVSAFQGGPSDWSAARGRELSRA